MSLVSLSFACGFVLLHLVSRLDIELLLLVEATLILVTTSLLLHKSKFYQCVLLFEFTTIYLVPF